jgi:hypothetical protein
MLLALIAPGPAIAQDRRAEYQFPAGISEETRRLIIRANSYLSKTCPAIPQYWSDVQEAAISYEWVPPDLRTITYQTQDYGWDRFLRYSIRFADQPRKLPRSREVFLYITGQTLWFELGAGSSPGILARKAGSHLLCGVEPGSADVLIPVAELEFLNGLPEGYPQAKP